MKYEFSVEQKPNYLHVHVSGDNTAENVRRYLREAYEAAAAAGSPSLLIEEDLRGSALDSVEVYRLVNEASAQTSPIVQRIAYVDLHAQRSPSNIELGEAIARDRGVNVRPFATVSAAAEWISEEASS